MSDQVLIPDSFFDPLPPPPPDIGMIYHDGPMIRTVRLSRDVESPHSALEVPVDDAMAFLTGERDPSGWVVWSGVNGKLSVVSLAWRLTLGTASTVGGPVTRVACREPSGMIFIRAVASVELGRLSFSFTAPQGTVVEEGENCVLRFIITDAEDDAMVLGSVGVPLAELVEERRVVVPLPSAACGRRIALHSDIRREWVDVGLIEATDGRGEIPLPLGQFVDMDRFHPDDGASCLLATYDAAAHRLIFEVRSGGGPRYDRELVTLPIIVSRPGDPAELITSFVVDVKQADKGRVIVSLPPSVKAPFELHAPLLFYRTRISTPPAD